jgi:hypothetical protein
MFVFHTILRKAESCINILVCTLYTQLISCEVGTEFFIIIIIITIIMALQPFVGPWPLFQFLDPIHSR